MSGARPVTDKEKYERGYKIGAKDHSFGMSNYASILMEGPYRNGYDAGYKDAEAKAKAKAP